MNAPRFNYSIPVIPQSEQIHLAEYSAYGEKGSRLLHIPYEGRCRYQSVCEGTEGNTNYAFGSFKSGWSSRVSVINKRFHANYVEAGHGYGLDVGVALKQIRAQFNGYVFVWKEETELDLEFHIMPWDFRTSKHMPVSPAECDLRLLHTANIDFFDSAMEQLIYS
jgi:hypothetical protein